jgi:hypothetical protein
MKKIILWFSLGCLGIIFSLWGGNIEIGVQDIGLDANEARVVGFAFWLLGGALSELFFFCMLFESIAYVIKGLKFWNNKVKYLAARIAVMTFASWIIWVDSTYDLFAIRYVISRLSF